MCFKPALRIENLLLCLLNVGFTQNNEVCLTTLAATEDFSKVHTSFTQVEVQILVFKNTLVKLEVLTKLLYSSQSKEGFEMYFSKKYP